MVYMSLSEPVILLKMIADPHPASASSAITVGATLDTSDAVADFSNIGKCLDIFTPGTNVIGAYFLYIANIRYFDTCYAAPHVTGTIALEISRFSNDIPAKVIK